MAGPLAGIRVIEMAGIGPGPMAATLLADLGAEVIRVCRSSEVKPGASGPYWDLSLRGRRSIGVDLKQADGVETVLKLVEQADALPEGFRPGVMERLGLGPDDCLARNPKIVFGRMTGWGQDGPYAPWAGHDINYISLAGSLAHFGRAGEAPVPPLNLVGDYGGGGMFLVFGLLAGVLEARTSGKGQVVDAAMVDGAAYLMNMFHSMKSIGVYDENARGENLLDTGAHFYDVFECSDGTYVSLGSIEPQFYALLMKHTGLDADPEFAHQMDKSRWPALKEKLAAVMKTKTRDEWCQIMEHTDICFAPVLTMTEAQAHPHNVARGTFTTVAGVPQPAPAPRFSRTTAEIQSPPAQPGEHTRAVLSDLGWSDAEIDALMASGAVA
jgi:alpha-methylacyl-CoA racemase